MIFDSISNIEKYKGVSERLYTALKALKEKDFADAEVGRHVIFGDEIFANVLEFETTTAEKDYEAHKKYIDVFYVVKGEAKVLLTQKSLCEVTEDYSEERDVERLKGNALSEAILRSQDETFLVCFPEDVHKPGVFVSENAGSKLIKKVVVKILV